MSDLQWYDAKEKSLLKAKDKVAALELLDRIEYISDEVYCAGWMHGIESELWTAIKANITSYKKYVPDLIDLNEKSGGWWYWDEELGGEIFLTTEEWEIKRKCG